jgi:hypothetical protein
MTYPERIKLYKRAGNIATKIFKEKYHNLCEVKITEEEPIIIKSVEFIHEVTLKVYASDDIRDDLRNINLYYIDKFLKDYFGINTDARRRIYRKKCDD